MSAELSAEWVWVLAGAEPRTSRLPGSQEEFAEALVSASAWLLIFCFLIFASLSPPLLPWATILPEASTTTLVISLLLVVCIHQLSFLISKTCPLLWVPCFRSPPFFRPTLAVPLQGSHLWMVPTQSPCYLSRAHFLGLGQSFLQVHFPKDRPHHYCTYS